MTTALWDIYRGNDDEAAPLPAARELMGIDLRSFLVLQIRSRGGALRVRDLVTLMDAAGFAVAGRPSKVISDALRWEIARGRVVRVGRGVYTSTRRIPRTTLSRMRARIEAVMARTPAPIREQPLRNPRPLVSADGPWRYRLRYALAPPRRPVPERPPRPPWHVVCGRALRPSSP